MAWVIGEFAYRSRTCSEEEVVLKLSDLLDRRFREDSTKSWILVAMIKIVANLDTIPHKVKAAFPFCSLHVYCMVLNIVVVPRYWSRSRSTSDLYL